MALISKIFVKTFNASRLLDEVSAFPIVSIGWAGFTRLDDRLYQPNATTKEIGRSVSNGVTVVDTAEPGELRFSLSIDLTPSEDDSLTSILASHNATQLSAEQIRQDQDEADWLAITATERQAYIDALASWDAANNAQKLVLAKQMFATVGKLMRLVIRAERGSAI